jgi:hypothetical protein
VGDRWSIRHRWRIHSWLIAHKSGRGTNSSYFIDIAS